LGGRALQMEVSKTERRKAEEKRRESGMCSKATKCTAGEKAGTFLMGKGVGVQ